MAGRSQLRQPRRSCVRALLSPALRVALAMAAVGGSGGAQNVPDGVLRGTIIAAQNDNAHSDGTCGSQSGPEVPCPVLEAARREGSNFVALNDHDAVSQNGDLHKQQLDFDQPLNSAARDYHLSGHANLFGVTILGLPRKW